MEKQDIVSGLAKLRTSEEVSADLNIKKSTVQKWARIFGIMPICGTLLFSQAEVELIRKRGDKRYGKKTKSL